MVGLYHRPDEPGDQPLNGIVARTALSFFFLVDRRCDLIQRHSDWNVGRRIHAEILQKKRAAYGEEIVVTLSRQLAAEFGNGFSKPNVLRMVQFAEHFPEQRIVVTLSRQLTRSHFLAIFPVADPVQREFYVEMCRLERWSVRTLRKKIGATLFERTALSKKPARLAR